MVVEIRAKLGVRPHRRNHSNQMPQKRNSGRKVNRPRRMRIRNRAGAPSNGPPATTLVYRGPSLLRTLSVPEIREVSLRASKSLSSSAAAITDDVFTSNSVRTLGADFSAWASLYREYRVLSLRVDFTPAFTQSLNNAQALATGTAVFSTVVDRDDSSPIVALANVLSNDSLRLFPVNQHWFRFTQMNSPGEAEFIPIGSDPAQYFSIKANLGVAAPTSVAWGIYITNWIVQFRTRI